MNNDYEVSVFVDIIMVCVAMGISLAFTIYFSQSQWKSSYDGMEDKVTYTVTSDAGQYPSGIALRPAEVALMCYFKSNNYNMKCNRLQVQSQSSAPTMLIVPDKNTPWSVYKLTNRYLPYVRNNPSVLGTNTSREWHMKLDTLAGDGPTTDKVWVLY